MLTHTASSNVGAPDAMPTSNELDRGKKSAYFDSTRAAAAATRDTISAVRHNWFSGRITTIAITIINRFRAPSLPPSRKRQRMSAVKTPIIADNGWMTDR